MERGSWFTLGVLHENEARESGEMWLGYCIRLGKVQTHWHAVIWDLSGNLVPKPLCCAYQRNPTVVSDMQKTLSGIQWLEYIKILQPRAQSKYPPPLFIKRVMFQHHSAIWKQFFFCVPRLLCFWFKYILLYSFCEFYLSDSKSWVGAFVKNATYT